MPLKSQTLSPARMAWAIWADEPATMPLVRGMVNPRASSWTQVNLVAPGTIGITCLRLPTAPMA
eukprot:4243053-Pyramimonas_sp.AAC.1